MPVAPRSLACLGYWFAIDRKSIYQYFQMNLVHFYLCAGIGFFLNYVFNVILEIYPWFYSLVNLVLLIAVLLYTVGNWNLVRLYITS